MVLLDASWPRGLAASRPPGLVALWPYPRGLVADGVTIKVVAIVNNTYGHHGEMTLPEVSLVKGPIPY